MVLQSLAYKFYLLANADLSWNYAFQSLNCFRIKSE